MGKLRVVCCGRSVVVQEKLTLTETASRTPSPREKMANHAVVLLRYDGSASRMTLLNGPGVFAFFASRAFSDVSTTGSGSLGERG
eukprot:scaffold231737_cov30-Tisochrysis_lutea.AAC.2